MEVESWGEEMVLENGGVMSLENYDAGSKQGAFLLLRVGMGSVLREKGVLSHGEIQNAVRPDLR